MKKLLILILFLWMIQNRVSAQTVNFDTIQILKYQWGRTAGGLQLDDSSYWYFDEANLRVVVVNEFTNQVKKHEVKIPKGKLKTPFTIRPDPKLNTFTLVFYIEPVGETLPQDTIFNLQGRVLKILPPRAIEDFSQIMNNTEIVEMYYGDFTIKQIEDTVSVSNKKRSIKYGLELPPLTSYFSLDLNRNIIAISKTKKEILLYNLAMTQHDSLNTIRLQVPIGSINLKANFYKYVVLNGHVIIEMRNDDNNTITLFKVDCILTTR